MTPETDPQASARDEAGQTLLDRIERGMGLWSRGPWWIKVAGKRWLFEFHGVCGPVVLYPATEEPMDRQPGARSPFWDAERLWREQGARVVAGVAQWEPETWWRPLGFSAPPRVKHLGGNHYLVIGSDNSRLLEGDPR
ncbi:MAG: hypothetical protein ACXW27_09050 [Allosphingosinicella sp.]